MTEALIVERDAHIVTLTLNSPQKMNAMNEAMWQGLGDIFSDLEHDDSVRCVVLRGAGDKAFSAGADIEEFPRTRLDKAHARAVLAGCSAGIPVGGGRLLLGTWQGLFLWEHRSRPHERRVVVTVCG